MTSRERERGTYTEIVFISALLSLVLWFCGEMVWGGKLPFYRDLAPYFYPIRLSLAKSLSAGELPLWDRHTGAGFPLLASFQSGAFYPPHLALVFLPFFSAISVIFLFHYTVAATGSYLLCRRWNHPPYLSLIGAVLFTFGGTVVSLTNLLNHFQSAVWLPWVVLLWERLLRDSSWSRFLIFAAILALQLLAGSPEIFAMTMGLVLLDGLRIKRISSDISYIKLFSLVAGANVIVVLLVMAQLLPTAELFFESRRQASISPHEALHWSLKPSSLLNLFFLDKELDGSLSTGARFFYHREPPLLMSYYLGAITVFGCAIWLFTSSAREAIVLLGAMVISLIITLGNHTPVYPFLFQHFPIVGVFRFPEKFFFFTYALIFYASIKGLAAWLGGHRRSIKQSGAALVFVSLVWLVLYIAVRFNVDILAHFIAQQTGQSPPIAVDPQVIVDLISNVERQLVLFFALLLLLVLSKTKFIRESVCSVLLVSTVFVDLSWAHRAYLFPLHPGFVYEDQRILTVPDPHLHRLFYYPPGLNIHPNYISVLGNPSYKEATALSFQNLLPNAGIFYGLEYMQELDALARQPYTDFVNFANQQDLPSRIQLLRAFNVEYLVSFRSLSAEGLTLGQAFPEYYSWLYRVDRPIPRTYIVNEVGVETNSEQILTRLADPGFDPSRQVILDKEIALKKQRPLEATANIVRYENNRVTIHTAANDEGILVLADSYYPGWKVYVDGKEGVIRRANHFFRAVVLPEGKHVVEFRYEPRSFKIGVAISLSTIAALIGTSILVFIRRRKKDQLKYLS